MTRFFFNFHEKFAEMSENLKKPVHFQDKNSVRSVQFEKKIRTIRTIRTFRTILGLQNKKSVQSVHFGHPVYGLQNLSLKQRLNSFRIHFVTVQFFLKFHPLSSLC